MLISLFLTTASFGLIQQMTSAEVRLVKRRLALVSCLLQFDHYCSLAQPLDRASASLEIASAKVARSVPDKMRMKSRK